MDDEELDEWFLLLRIVHDLNIRRATLHGQQAQIRTQGNIVSLEYVIGYLFYHRFHQNGAGINSRSQASWITP